MLKPHDKANIIEALNALYQMVEQQPVETRCQDCIHYGSASHCMKWNDKIPESAKAAGCDAWEFVGTIPF